MRLEPRHLQVVLAVSDHGSISAAARDLGVSQPGLTNQLRRIEHVCGVALFERHARGVRPTDAGRDVLRHARRIVAQLGELGTTSVRTASTTRLRVVSSPGLLDTVLPTLVLGHPGHTWSVDTCSETVAVRAVQEGTCDLAVLLRWPYDDPPTATDVVRREITSAPLRALVPEGPGHAEEIDLSELAGRQWVVRSAPAARRTVDLECRRAGFTPQVRLAVDHPCTLAELVAGTGVVALDLEPPAPHAGVVAVPYPGAARVTVHAVHRPDEVDAGMLDELCTALSRPS